VRVGLDRQVIFCLPEVAVATAQQVEPIRVWLLPALAAIVFSAVEKEAGQVTQRVSMVETTAAVVLVRL
jgi:hypothetical protein